MFKHTNIRKRFSFFHLFGHLKIRQQQSQFTGSSSGLQIRVKTSVKTWILVDLLLKYVQIWATVDDFGEESFVGEGVATKLM